MNSKVLFILIGVILTVASFGFTWYKNWNWYWFGVTAGVCLLFNLCYNLFPIIFKERVHFPMEEEYIIITYGGKEYDLSIESHCEDYIKRYFLRETKYVTRLTNENYHLPIFKGKENVPKTPLYMAVAKDERQNIWYKIILNRSNGEIGVKRFKTEKEALDDKTEELMATHIKERVKVTEEFEKEIEGEKKKVKRTITPAEEVESEEEIE